MPSGSGRFSQRAIGAAADEQRRYTVAVDITYGGAGDSTLWTPPAGTRWAIYYLHLRASAALSLQVKSGTTAVTGPLALTYAAAGEKTHTSSGEPIAVGRAVGEALVLTSTAAGDVDGWVTVSAIAGAGPS